MDFRVTKVAVDTHKTSCIVVGVFESRRLSPAASALNDASRGLLLKRMGDFDMQGGVGDTLVLNDLPNVAAGRVLLVGCGKKKKIAPSQFRRMLSSALQAMVSDGFKDATSCLAEINVEDRDTYWKIRQTVETALARLEQY